MAGANKENNFESGNWIVYLVLTLAILTIVFAIYSCICGPPVDPPTYMKSSDPYWYSGE